MTGLEPAKRGVLGSEDVPFSIKPHDQIGADGQGRTDTLL